MAKVICERPRRKNNGNLALRLNRHEARIDPEEAPRIIGMKRLHAVYVGWEGLKEHGDHCAPLERWLRKAVGRRFNDVLSEICRSCDRRSAVQLHVLVHSDMYVTRDVMMIDGVPHAVKPVFHKLWDGALYVDVHGMLCRHKQMK
jgi:hypothetical protein